MKNHLLTILMMASVITGCSPKSQTKQQPEETMKTEPRQPSNSVFDLNETEGNFLEEHRVKRMYLRLFDVVTADKNTPSDFRIKYEAVPNATMVFREPMPEGVEIVPVIYITIDALRLIIDSKKDYAGLITERILNMADFNDLGTIQEVQLDCDWTQQTQDGYFAFCQAVKDKLEPLGIQLSCTIRLWQLACACPPVDRGVLMLYNTGNIANPNTQNSILDLNDVKTYLKGKPYDLPLDFAYPTYSWCVGIRNGQFLGLFHDLELTNNSLYSSGEFENYISGDTYFLVVQDHIAEGHQLLKGDMLRYEYVSVAQLSRLDQLIREKFALADSASIILYHLDSANLSNYTANEIRQIYHHN